MITKSELVSSESAPVTKITNTFREGVIPLPVLITPLLCCYAWGFRTHRQQLMGELSPPTFPPITARPATVSVPHINGGSKPRC